MPLQPIIGLEIHVQISTKTKMFCGCDNDSWGKEPNTNVCPVCMGFPGQLPVINEEAVMKAIKAALALHCTIPECCKFDRKNYFYPDNPKGFQISQFDEPLSKNGFLEVPVYNSSGKEERRIKVRIKRLHLEDDAGKLTHVKDGSLVDFNRAGTPLMEIVSEPDLRSAFEARAYAQELQKIMRYVGASDSDMEKGMMRFDASVSLRPLGEDKLYPRAEIKNLNSFKALENAVDYEISRQTELWTKGKPLNKPVTMGWDDENRKTYFMRDKEESDDYRYFPEPDLPPLKIDKKVIENLRREVPELPEEKKKRYVEAFQIAEEDARILASDSALAEFFEKTANGSKNAKMAVSFITTVLMKYLKEDLVGIDAQKVTPEMIIELIDLVEKGKISYNIAKGEIFEEMYKTGKRPGKIVEDGGYKLVSDNKVIEAACKKVISENPGPVSDVKNGKQKAIGFLVGQVMKETKDQANPQIVSKILKKLL